jgi:hypothetical protein
MVTRLMSEIDIKRLIAQARALVDFAKDYDSANYFGET